MSLVLSPSDSGLLRKVFTNSFVAITPDVKSSPDFNGNQTDRRMQLSPANVDHLTLVAPHPLPPPSLPLSSPSLPLSSPSLPLSSPSPGIMLQPNTSSTLVGRSTTRPYSGMAQTSASTPHSDATHANSNNNNNNNNINNANNNNNMAPPILNLAKIEEPEALGSSYPSNVSASDQMNKNSFPSPLASLAKIDETRAFTLPNRTYKACSPVDEGGTAITITSATPETKTDSEAVEPGIGFSLLSTPLSKKPREASGSSDPRKWFKSPVIRRSDITFGRCIGKGGFGTVHEGTIAGRPVAIKVVKKRRGSGIHREILQAERLAFRLNLRHKNIVAILGVNMCDDLRGDALIVMELVTSRSLHELLNDVTRPLHRKERFRFAAEIASALHYLHSNDVAHLDVKPANVQMTSESVCKLSDFGSLTRTGPHVAREEVEYTQLLGTLPYRAPELMQGLFPSTKADLYSYGIVLWQMVTREEPHKNENPHSLIYQVVKWNIRPNVPDPGADEIDILYTNLYTSCWNGDADERPRAGKVLEILNSTRHQIP